MWNAQTKVTTQYPMDQRISVGELVGILEQRAGSIQRGDEEFVQKITLEWVEVSSET
jgi:hypothetical protein